jgi:hypothetical protein
MPDPSQFDIDRTYPGRWTITFSNPPINMFVPTTIVELGALMTDLEADPSVKVVVLPGGQARRARLRSLDYGVPGDFEMNFGRYLPSLGRAGDEDTDPPLAGGPKGTT